MIPRYFPQNTSYEDLRNGVGTELKNCFSCTVVQEKAGVYNCTVEIGTENTVEAGGYIKAKTCNNLQPQIFKIVSVSLALKRITLSCEHIKFLLNDLPIIALTPNVLSGTAAGEELITRANAFYKIPFAFKNLPQSTQQFSWSDYDYHTFTEYLSSENEYSLSTIFNGYFEFDNFDVIFHSNINSDSGVKIEYGKNLIDINYQIDTSSVYNCVFPIYYRTNSESDTEICFFKKPNPRLYKNGDYVHNSGEHVFPNTSSLFKLSNYDDTKPKPYILNVADSESEYGYHFSSVAAVSSTAIENFMTDWIADNKQWLTQPTVSATAEFVDTGKSKEFAEYENLQNLNVGKTVKLVIPPLKINTSVTVVGTTYDSLTERFTALSLSSEQKNISNAMIKQQKKYKRLLKSVEGIPTLMATITDTKIN